MIDTLKISKELEAATLSKAQAEAIATALAEVSRQMQTIIVKRPPFQCVINGHLTGQRPGDILTHYGAEGLKLRNADKLDPGVGAGLMHGFLGSAVCIAFKGKGRQRSTAQH